MRDRRVFCAWGAMFVICALLGLLPESDGFLGAVCFLCGIGFFVPPYLLFRSAVKTGNRNTLKLLAALSGTSLALTLVLIIANILSVKVGSFLGNLLHALLAIVSAPMFCCRYWVLSLFLWAMIMTNSLRILRKKS